MTPCLPAAGPMRRRFGGEAYLPCMLLSLLCLLASIPPALGAGGVDGLILLGEWNCVACHAPSAKAAAWLTPKTPPRLADLGSRASATWLQRYLVSPHEALPGTSMPDVLHGIPEAERAVVAEALTHYLLSLSPSDFRRVLPDRAAVARGDALYHRIGCVACHAPQDASTNTMTAVSLPRMAEKWSFDGLRRFLLDPLAIRPSGRMPAMNLTDREAADLAHFLLRETRVSDDVRRGSKEPGLRVEWEGPGVPREVIPTSRLRHDREPIREEPLFVVDPIKAARGRSLYSEWRCDACHEPKPPGSSTHALAGLQPMNGCLAEEPSAGVPNYHLDAKSRAALGSALVLLDQADLAAPSAGERLAHTLASLRCLACHGRDGEGGVRPERNAYFTSNGEDLGDEGRLPPRLDGVGDRLRPTWLSQVLATGAGVRSYMNTRMPQFGPDNVRHLTELFVTLDRRQQDLPPVSDTPEVQREAGRRMVGTDGLSCIACHRFNRQPGQAFQVIDLTTATERLNEDWFRRFLLDPGLYHPGTRMPSFWPEGVSPMTGLLEGNTTRQHAALWTYLADGSRARFPEGLSRQNMERVVGGETVVYRGKLWEAGFRAVAVGYPGQWNAAFDAEEMRLALLWRGRFLNAGSHWGVQGMGSIRPLGTNIVVFPHGTAFAVIEDAKAPWPEGSSKSLGMRFRGYQLDALGSPTLLYSYRDVAIEDSLAPIERDGIAGLRRILRFAGTVPEGLHLRLASGRVVRVSETMCRVDGTLTLRVGQDAEVVVRGAGDRQELLIPIGLRNGKGRQEVDYVW